jgi:DNA repair protein RadA/Sms
LKEAAKLGFAAALVPKANAPKRLPKELEGLTLYPVDRIEQALTAVREMESGC